MALVILGRRTSSGRPLATSIATELPIVVFGPASLVLIGDCSVVSVAETVSDWTPADLAVAPFAWYDAQDVGTITQAAGAVSQWEDKSGNDLHLTQSTGAQKPTYNATAINSLPALVFDGGDGLRNAAFALTGADTAVFVVAISDAGNANSARLVSLAAAGEADYESTAGAVALAFGTDGGGQIFSTANVGTRGNPISLAADTPALVAAIDDGTDWQMWLNGTSSASSSYTPVLNTATLGVGIQASSDSDYWTGTIGEVLILAYDPSTPERQQIEGYLAWRWGIEADLPGGHPYLAAPP